MQAPENLLGGTITGLGGAIAHDGGGSLTLVRGYRPR